MPRVSVLGLYPVTIIFGILSGFQLGPETCDNMHLLNVDAEGEIDQWRWVELKKFPTSPNHLKIQVNLLILERCDKLSPEPHSLSCNLVFSPGLLYV